METLQATCKRSKGTHDERLGVRCSRLSPGCAAGGDCALAGQLVRLTLRTAFTGCLGATGTCEAQHRGHQRCSMAGTRVQKCWAWRRRISQPKRTGSAEPAGSLPAAKRLCILAALASIVAGFILSESLLPGLSEHRGPTLQVAIEIPRSAGFMDPASAQGHMRRQVICEAQSMQGPLEGCQSLEERLGLLRLRAAESNPPTPGRILAPSAARKAGSWGRFELREYPIGNRAEGGGVGRPRGGEAIGGKMGRLMHQSDAVCACCGGSFLEDAAPREGIWGRMGRGPKEAGRARGKCRKPPQEGPSIEGGCRASGLPA